ncbi:hypothetical protein fh0823_02370 [Francisella halioticida]|nr:hypothetical protein fh0823_02370 [Francisella halioticida]
MNSKVFSFCQIAAFNRVAIDAKQIQHEYGDTDGSISEVNLLRAIKANNFKAKAVTLKPQNINPRVLSIILQDNNGDNFVLAGIQDNEYLVIQQGSKELLALSESDLAEIYNNRAILITYKDTAKDSQESFNIKWFVPALWKYRHIFKDVLIVSLFIQLFGLVTPFFFQVVMDKVIMHNGLTTLNTLAIVFLVVAIFEVLFGTIRTYLFSHTTSRLDVVLGSKLF